MKIIEIKTESPYSVLIEDGLRKKVGYFLHEIKKTNTVVIVSDSTVYPLYGDEVSDSLKATGLKVLSFVFPAGEASKCTSTYFSLLNYLAENKITRSDLLIALGGGVVGDLTGFAAATYLRGVDYIQIPTTLLAAVDSSVGGKTAIDLPSGKNLVGAFHQPISVICDPETFRTLPKDIFLGGCAEVIKYSILFDSDFFRYLSECGTDFDYTKVIARCVELKRDVVQEDEYDTGKRQLLNLGHTFGHGVEIHSNFTLSHGFSVAVGMAIIARAAAEFKICSPETATLIESILKKFSLPTQTDIPANELLDSALSDKKRSGNSINLIIPEEIGHCRIQPTSVEEILSYLKAGLS